MVKLEIIELHSNADEVGNSPTDSEGDENLIGMEGDDFIFGIDGDENTIDAEEDDYIFGIDGDDTLNGGDSYDDLDGGDDDMMTGGEGDDTYIWDSADDEVYEDFGDGTDQVCWMAVTYGLPENVEYLTLTGPGEISARGNGKRNTLRGDEGDDALNGDGGNDSLDGGKGNDSLHGGDGNDDLNGGRGTDNLNGGGGGDTLNGGRGNDNLDGGRGSDILKGGRGNDNLTFDSADSLVDGGRGAHDKLSFNGGNQTLYLNTTAGSQYVGLEIVDLSGAGNNTLVLNASEVLNLSDTDQLRVDGNSGDIVILDLGWTQADDPVTIGENSYYSYTQGNATLLVDMDITTSLLVLPPVSLFEAL